MQSAASPPRIMSRPVMMFGLLGVVAVVGVVAVATLSSPVTPEANKTIVGRSTGAESALEPRSLSPHAIPQSSATAASTSVPTSFVPSDSATATVVTSPDNLVAITPQDKAWLAKHGYPTKTEREWSKQASFDELAAAARTSPAFAALYGERLWESDRYREGKAMLLDALARGSLYAAESIAVRTLQDGRRADGTNGSLFEAAAWWLYAAQMGNYHASDAMTSHVRGLDSDSLGLAMTRVFGIAQEVDAARASMGLAPAVRDVRPSFDDYLENRGRRNVIVVPR